jgi:hypothetical protein
MVDSIIGDERGGTLGVSNFLIEDSKGEVKSYPVSSYKIKFLDNVVDNTREF